MRLYEAQKLTRPSHSTPTLAGPIHLSKGGQKILLKYAGKDATEEYLPIHPKGTIDELAPECHLGPVDMSTVTKVVVEEVKAPTGAAPVTLGGCINIADIEVRCPPRCSVGAVANHCYAVQAAAEALLKPKAFGASPLTHWLKLSLTPNSQLTTLRLPTTSEVSSCAEPRRIHRGRVGSETLVC